MRTHHRGLSGNAVEFEHPYMPASSSQPFSSKPCESVKFLGGCLPDAAVVVFLVVQLQFKFAFCVSAEGCRRERGSKSSRRS